MPSEITMAVIAVVMALTLPASGNSHRGAYSFQTAQYCMPQDDELADMMRTYC